MLSLSRVNISYMCLNMSPPHWNPAFKCAWGIGMRTVGNCVKGVSCVIRSCTYEWDLNV